MTQPPSGSHRAGPPEYGDEPVRRPRKRTLLPWLIGAAVLLIAGLGTLLLFLLDGDAGGQRGAGRVTVATTGQQEQPARSSTAPVEEAGQLPDGAQVTEPVPAVEAPQPVPAEEATQRVPAEEAPLVGGGQVTEPVPAEEAPQPGSADVALAWVEAMGQGDFQTAYDLSCAKVQKGTAAAAAAAGEEPAQVLGDYFRSSTLGGQGFTSGTLDGIEHLAESASDMASFTLELDDGEPFLLLVHVEADGSVCDFY